MLKGESCCAVLSEGETFGSMPASPMMVTGTISKEKQMNRTSHTLPHKTRGALRAIQSMLFHYTFSPRSTRQPNNSLEKGFAPQYCKILLHPTVSHYPTKLLPSCCIHADPSEVISALPLPAPSAQPHIPAREPNLAPTNAPAKLNRDSWPAFTKALTHHGAHGVLVGEDPTLPVIPQIWGFLPPFHKVIQCPGPTAVLINCRAGLWHGNSVSIPTLGHYNTNDEYF